VLIMLIQASRPHVAFLGRLPGTTLYSDITRHPENQPIPGVLAFRPDGSLLYVNTESVLETVLARLASEPPDSVHLVVCDLSAAPHLDLAAVGILRKLHATLESRGIRLAVAGPHGGVRDLLRREGFADLVGGIARIAKLETILAAEEASETGIRAGVNARSLSIEPPQAAPQYGNVG
jgi:sulfate permease, SulP family